jgi:hypothetical protein
VGESFPEHDLGKGKAATCLGRKGKTICRKERIKHIGGRYPDEGRNKKDAVY